MHQTCERTILRLRPRHTVLSNRLLSPPRMGAKNRKDDPSFRNDVIPQDSKKTDIVILVMGTTGAGKSTFINTALGDERMKVGHSLAACTTEVTPVIIDPAPGSPIPKGYRLVLVDTPGFDVSYEDDQRNLEQVTEWLDSYRKKTTIGGVIYLYNLIHGRFSGVTRRSLENIWRLCADAGLGKVVLSTTNGEGLAPEERSRRERKLAPYWTSFIDKGAAVHHFRKEANSAWELNKEFIPSPSELERASQPQIPIFPLSDAQITIERAQGDSSLTLDAAILEDCRNTDIVIPIMGPTGAGKSTFINFVLGSERMEVGHDIDSCTADLFRVVIDPIPGFPDLRDHRLVLLDTPGFDDTFVDDVEILKRIATWLAASYRQHMTVGGVLYLHDISTKRFTGTARINLQTFQHLCGGAALNKVILGTTNWGVGTTDHDRQHQQHEEEMRVEHWSPLLHQGAEVRRFLGSSASAWDILNIFLQRADNARRLSQEVDPLQIQKEVVDDRMPVRQTKAGRFLNGVRERIAKRAQTTCSIQ
ncbi:hypothetical protein M413DRAFT_193634 [Hebeloma cylindrosporum]|uniref:G domain-containing protein n=1 Tax=Hebeloma cylindrosporum TaxID=76867 RepID=A0A0C2XPR6_HEBCY|nr:hypothetical protein M413DRAFT_193634 [Hebeloma cylindrosporum h7]